MRPYSLFDQVATTLAFIGFSLPTFFTGLLLILIFSIWLDWLPFVYQTNVEGRSEEHTSELQSLMRNSYAVFCLKKKKTNSIRKLHNNRIDKYHHNISNTSH